MHEEDLLAAIRANPDDDAPRMLYADALLERGDPRGQYIQYRLLRQWDPDTRQVEDAWRQELGTKLWIEFDRGFPVQLRGSAERLAAVRHVIARYPITRVVVEDTQFAPLAAASELQHVRELVLFDEQNRIIAPEVWAEIAAAPLAPKRLIVGCQLDDAGAAQLATAPWLPALHTFSAWAVPRTSATRRRMAEAPRLTEVGFAALARRGLPELRELVLRDVSRFGDAGVAALIAANPTKLHSLWLQRTGVTAAGAGSLLSSRLVQTLEVLSLRQNAVSSGIAALREAPQLRSLDLSIAELGNAASSLATAIMPKLVEMWLVNNQLTREVMVAFAAARWPVLEHLEMNGNGFTHATLEPLRGLRGMPALKRLGLQVGRDVNLDLPPEIAIF
ncbi:MAG: TIGR02996 domain-containing protein [Kofleriaceae bacterium]